MVTKDKTNQLTVPWDERLEEAHEHKALKYHNLRRQCIEGGFKTWCLPVEVGCRGFVNQSTWKALGMIGITGRKRREIVGKLAEAAEMASRWVWHCSGNISWKQS